VSTHSNYDHVAVTRLLRNDDDVVTVKHTIPRHGVTPHLQGEDIVSVGKRGIYQ
jgi:hypothetical protein